MLLHAVVAKPIDTSVAHDDTFLQTASVRVNDAYNLRKVGYYKPAKNVYGQLRMKTSASGKWVWEWYQRGVFRGTFTEDGRDQWTVTLSGANNVLIFIDIHTNSIEVQTNGVSNTDPITIIRKFFF